MCKTIWAGAVMYLFRGEFGCMLYTGDFRWESTSERVQIARTMLLNALKNEKLDTLYLDNTYCNPQYSFPSRNVAAGQVRFLMWRALCLICSIVYFLLDKCLPMPFIMLIAFIYK